ncbi:MAG: hypothetical protein HOV83_31845 [Catenulispora sp.]|nr:hypothetical protein [Catenulispora sp.]
MTEPPVLTELGFSDAEWGLLVGLPQSVLLAASAIEPDGTRRTAAENEAGLEAITDGVESPSKLVSAVAAEITSRLHEAELPVFTPADPQSLVTDVLDRSRAALDLLAGKAEAADASAYRHWLVTIAESVVEAASSGGLLGLGGTVVSDAESAFVADLSHLLKD